MRPALDQCPDVWDCQHDSQSGSNDCDHDECGEEHRMMSADNWGERGSDSRDGDQESGDRPASFVLHAAEHSKEARRPGIAGSRRRPGEPLARQAFEKTAELPCAAAASESVPGHARRKFP